ncbi:single-stranded DNA-binding protein [Fusobacterium necrophorum]|uniref:single-stranded DNA-binding protein n=1 Tax=Fusobacterium necrophorum TaxID=859 RepID=UPI0007868407|nr:single-stranded DNA-binding protein [Fusobacterium necrophorum]KYM42241.1 single-stranded DNA-binding protein [Fusobacterium necrophorum subsp. funduliforme]
MNSFHGIGRLTANAELKKSQDKSYCRFSLAISYGEEKVDFFPCIIFGKYAESIYSYLTKGKLVAIEGSLHNNQYEKDGETRYYTSISVDKIQLLESKKENENKKED